MGQLGRTKDGAYPDLTLIEAIDLVKKMNVVGGPISLTTLAKIVGIDPRGAGLRSRVQDLKAFGLIEENGGLKLSALGREVAHGNPTKTWEAFVNIPLYSKIHDRVQGNDIESEAFWQVLYEITKAEDDAITRRMVRLKNNYMEALPYFEGEGQTSMQKAEADRKIPTHDSQAFIYPVSTMKSDFYLVDRRGTPYFIGIDSAKKADFAIDYLKDAKGSLPGGKRGTAERKSKDSPVEATGE